MKRNLAFSAARTTDTRGLNPKFFAAQIQTPIPNEYKNLVTVEMMVE